MDVRLRFSGRNGFIRGLTSLRSLEHTSERTTQVDSDTVILQSAKSFCGHGSEDSQPDQQHTEDTEGTHNHSCDRGPVAEDNSELNAFPQQSPGAKYKIRSDAEIRTKGNKASTGKNAASAAQYESRPAARWRGRTVSVASP